MPTKYMAQPKCRGATVAFAGVSHVWREQSARRRLVAYIVLPLVVLFPMS